jgi:hypothetical protein
MSGAQPQDQGKNKLAASDQQASPHSNSQLKEKHNALKKMKHAKKSKEKTSKKQKKTHKSNKSKKNVAGKASGKNKANRQSDSCLAANCLDLAVSYMSLVRTKVANYQKQTTRLSRLNAASGSKAAKQNVFANSLNQLITAGGGNVSNLTCGSSTSNAGKPLFLTFTKKIKVLHFFVFSYK